MCNPSVDAGLGMKYLYKTLLGKLTTFKYGL